MGPPMLMLPLKQNILDAANGRNWALYSQLSITGRWHRSEKSVNFEVDHSYHCTACGQQNLYLRKYREKNGNLLALLAFCARSNRHNALMEYWPCQIQNSREGDCYASPYFAFLAQAIDCTTTEKICTCVPFFKRRGKDKTVLFGKGFC